MPGLYIGLMSGTSLDGVDGVLAQLGDAPFTSSVVARSSMDMPATGQVGKYTRKRFMKNRIVFDQ